jgi:hypothetical protein
MTVYSITSTRSIERSRPRHLGLVLISVLTSDLTAVLTSDLTSDLTSVLISVLISILWISCQPHESLHEHFTLFLIREILMRAVTNPNQFAPN